MARYREGIPRNELGAFPTKQCGGLTTNLDTGDDVTTIGADAAANCDDFGWQPRGEIDPNLVAETVQNSQYGYGRAWSQKSGYSLRPDTRLLYLVHTVEGGFDFTVDGTAVRSEAGEVVVFDSAAPATAQTLTDTARYVWFVPAVRLSAAQGVLPPHEPLALATGPLQGLISLTNALLNSGAPTSRAAHDHIGLAMENMLVAALHEDITFTDEDAMNRDGLFTAAVAVIRTRFRDPGFGVPELARELSASVSHVHRVFTTMGTTPRRELERHRLEEVAMRQALAPSPREIIEASGFSSVRQYRRALARSQGMVVARARQNATL